MSKDPVGGKVLEPVVAGSSRPPIRDSFSGPIGFRSDFRTVLVAPMVDIH